jgi:hypothetical protein
MMYLIFSGLLFIGGIGMVVQTLLGGVHFGHGPHAGHVTHVGHGHGHGQDHSHATPRESGGGRMGALLMAISPLTVFSVCLGVGATGLLLRREHLHGDVVLSIAVIGGVLFYALIIQPVRRLIFQFASRPSEALEGAVAQEAEVLTPFDTKGQGIVRLIVDGQAIRILATLDPKDRAAQRPVTPGERLTVVSVDGHTNTCRVARL